MRCVCVCVCVFVCVCVVVRLFIDTQNRLVVLHSALIKAHEETDLSPTSVIYRPVGSTMQLVTKLSSPNFAVLQGHRYLCVCVCVCVCV